MNRTGWALLLAGLLTGAASAAPIYRCGPDGRVYSQIPCAGGEIVEASDPRSAAQRAEARRIAAQERKTGSELERTRRADESTARANAPAAIHAQPLAAEPEASSTERSKRSRPRARRGDTDVPFTATVPPRPSR